MPDKEVTLKPGESVKITVEESPPCPFKVGDWVKSDTGTTRYAYRVGEVRLHCDINDEWQWRQDDADTWGYCNGYVIVARDWPKQYEWPDEFKNMAKPAPALPGEWRNYPDGSGRWVAYDANEDYNPRHPIHVTLGGDGVVTNLHTGRRILRVNNIPPRWLRLPDAPPNA